MSVKTLHAESTGSVGLINYLPPEILVNVFSWIDPIDLNSASKVCRAWRDLADVGALWKDRLRRDFGEKAVSLVNNGLYKNEYFEKCKKIKFLLHPLSAKDKLLEISRADALKEYALPNLCGLVSLHALEQSRNLTLIFYFSMKSGIVSVVEAIIKSHRFKEISAVQQRGLGDSLSWAIGNGHTEVAALLMNSSRADEIETSEKGWGWGDAFLKAVETGNIDIMKILVKAKRFGEVNALEIGYAFMAAAKSGQVPALEIIEQIPRFKELDQAVMREAFLEALEDERTEALSYMMQTIPLDRMEENLFPFAFMYAAKNGKIVFMDVLIKSQWFKQTGNKKEMLLEAFLTAAQNGHPDTARLIIQEGEALGISSEIFRTVLLDTVFNDLTDVLSIMMYRSQTPQ